MKKFVFIILISSIVSPLCNSVVHATEKTNKNTRASELLKLANEAYEEKNYERAVILWGEIQTNYKGTDEWPKAVYNTGITLKEQKRFDEAIEIFKELLTSDVNDTEPGGCIMEAYRNYRPKALWEIGDCLLGKGDYAGALEAYKLTEEKHPFQTWCGTCQSGYEYRYALYQGLCLEYLGRYNEAVKSYYKAIFNTLSSDPTIHIRLADLYQEARQIDVLDKILNEIDTHLIGKIVREHGTKIYDDPDFDEQFATKTIRRVLEIRRLGEQKELNALIELLLTEGAGASPDKYRDRRQHWQAIEAAKALAQYPDKAVLLLKVEMKGNVEDKMIYYALALCGTDEAKSILEDEAKKVKNCWQENALIYSLNIIGKTEETSEADKGIYFPRLPTDVELPKRLSEIDDDVAYWQSLPQKVSIDLSKPELTIKTFITSMIIDDKNAHSKCFADSKLAEKMNEDDCRSLRTVYEITNVKFSNDNTSEVDVNLSIGHKSGRIMFILKNINNQWLITGFKEGSQLKTGK